jgi:hypothetical protein
MSETKPSEDKHYLIIGAATKEIIGCTTGDSGIKDVLSEEPANTEFREVEESACPVCKADEWESRPEGMVDPCMSQRVQPTTCPTCGSDRRDFCVGHCPDIWHGNGPISNGCLVDSTGKVVYPLPKVERYGYIGESGFSRYRVQYDTDGVGRSLYRDATPEEVAGFLAEKGVMLAARAPIPNDKPGSWIGSYCHICGKFYGSMELSRTVCYKCGSDRIAAPTPSADDATGVARQSQTLEAKYQKALRALREIQWKSPRSNGSNEHCPACNNWRFNCGGKGVHDGNCPIGNALKDAPAEKDNE